LLDLFVFILYFSFFIFLFFSLLFITYITKRTNINITPASKLYPTIFFVFSFIFSTNSIVGCFLSDSGFKGYILYINLTVLFCIFPNFSSKAFIFSSKFAFSFMCKSSSKFSKLTRAFNSSVSCVSIWFSLFFII